MTTQQKVVGFLKEIGTDKICEMFQVSRQVARVWVNSGNVPLAKLDRIMEEMKILEDSKKSAPEEVVVDAIHEEEKAPVSSPVGMTAKKVEGVEKTAPKGGEALPLTAVPTPTAPPVAHEDRFNAIFDRLDKLEEFARRMTDPDLVRGPAFTRPDKEANKPNAIMEYIPQTPKQEIMTEQEHEKRMNEIKLPGHDNWLEPHKKPQSKQ